MYRYFTSSTCYHAQIIILIILALRFNNLSTFDINLKYLFYISQHANYNIHLTMNTIEGAPYLV